MATVRLEPMTDAQYRSYRETANDGYARQIADAGATALDEARRKAEADFARLLPDGLATPGMHLWTAYADAEPVGLMWLHVEEKPDGRHAFVYDIEVREQARRQGHGRAIMRAAERACRDMGVVIVKLNVFGPNTGARALYEQEGFEVTSVQMHKRL
jgi:ribosomal protein S18 acetylase RimI-like enzyme